MGWIKDIKTSFDLQISMVNAQAQQKEDDEEDHTKRLHLELVNHLKMLLKNRDPSQKKKFAFASIVQWSIRKK